MGGGGGFARLLCGLQPHWGAGGPHGRRHPNSGAVCRRGAVRLTYFGLIPRAMTHALQAPVALSASRKSSEGSERDLGARGAGEVAGGLQCFGGVGKVEERSPAGPKPGFLLFGRC